MVVFLPRDTTVTQTVWTAAQGAGNPSNDGWGRPGRPSWMGMGGLNR